MNRRLYRSSTDRVLAGVAGGMAETYDMDPALVRVVWALLILFTGGVFLILYVIMALVVPLRDEEYGPPPAPPTGPDAGDTTYAQDAPGAMAGPTGPTGPAGPAGPAGPSPAYRPPRRRRESDNSGALILGAILIIVGALFLLRQFVPFDIGRLWPIAVIVLGILLIATAFARRESRA